MTLRLAIAVLACGAWAAPSHLQGTRVVNLRGHDQRLYMYGPGSGEPIIVSSGDGGWVHLGPHIADVLAANGYTVFGFDARAYLASFTTGTATLDPAKEPADYRVLADVARGTSRTRPILVGVSEGAGLSVLAATDPQTKAAIGGVVAVGLPDLNELGWRWRDSVIYLTHKVPNEPTFSAAAIVAGVAPLPLAVIHSTKDEFVALDVANNVFQHARDPKRLWVVPSSDHRFSDSLPQFDRHLFEALEWVKQQNSR